jgi:hypothetical protein
MIQETANLLVGRGGGGLFPDVALPGFSQGSNSCLLFSANAQGSTSYMILPVGRADAQARQRKPRLQTEARLGRPVTGRQSEFVLHSVRFSR